MFYIRSGYLVGIRIRRCNSLMLICMRAGIVVWDEELLFYESLKGLMVC